MKGATAKIVPKLLNFEQKQRSINIAQEMLSSFNDDPDLLKKIIICDESWVYIAMALKSNPKYSIPIKAPRRDKNKKSTSSSVKCEGEDAS